MIVTQNLIFLAINLHKNQREIFSLMYINHFIDHIKIYKIINLSNMSQCNFLHLVQHKLYHSLNKRNKSKKWRNKNSLSMVKLINSLLRLRQILNWQMNFCLHLFKRLDKKKHQRRELEIKWLRLLKPEDKKNKKKEQKKKQAVKI